MILKGRRKIRSDYNSNDILDVNILKQAIKSAYSTHILNKAEIDYLVNYKNGNQEILKKEKTIRPEINNKIVINHAQMISRVITGYFLGTPIQYVQATAEKKEQLDLLNQIVNYEDKCSVDKDLAEMQSICGTAYRIIFTDGVYGDEVPFEDRMLNPSQTFVVYENTIAEKPLFGVTYHEVYNSSMLPVGFRIYCYTEYGVYTFVQSDFTFTEVTEFEFTPYSIGGVPIIEYPNNIWRIGDWELVIDVMEAVNTLESGRMDDIEQVIQSLVVFINADIDAEMYNEMREAGVVLLKNTTNAKSEVDVIKNPLDQASMTVLAEEFEKLIYALIGIPDRNNRTAGGGDTGTAVELRDGWADLEIVARNKELTFKRSEKMSLKIMLSILNNTSGTNLSLLDINIKFSRNKNSNLLVKTQAYMNLIQSKTLDPADCLTIVDLVSDVADFIARGKTFWGDSFAGKAELEASLTPKTPTDTVDITE